MIKSVAISEHSELASSADPTEYTGTIDKFLSNVWRVSENTTARSKTWDNFLKDPWVFVGSSSNENLGQIHDISVTLTEAQRPPGLSLWVTCEFKKTTLGWTTSLGNESTLTLLLKNSSGGVVFERDLANEMAIGCKHKGKRVSFSFEIDTDIYDIVKGVGFSKSSQTWKRC